MTAVSDFVELATGQLLLVLYILAPVRLPISRSLYSIAPSEIGNSTHTTIPDVCSSTDFDHLGSVATAASDLFPTPPNTSDLFDSVFGQTPSGVSSVNSASGVDCESHVDNHQDGSDRKRLKVSRRGKGTGRGSVSQKTCCQNRGRGNEQKDPVLAV